MKICIVAHNAFASLTGQKGHIGGVELQTAMLAKYLAQAGHSVSFITWDPGTSEPGEIEGVRIIRLCRQDSGIPVLRFFYPRWSSLRRALQEADADVYYQNGAESVTGQVALYCEGAGKAFVFSVASDTDCDANLPALASIREKVLYRLGLKRAASIIVQTDRQRDALRDAFSLSSVILPMPCDTEPQLMQRTSDSIAAVLWVGRVIASKRLELYLDVAAKMPDLIFHIAGGADDDLEYAAQVIGRARSIKNIVVHGPLDRDKLQELYQQVDVFVCTSILEGFPNTFLEAWANGLPVVSTFDPDNKIAEHKLGFAVADATAIIVKLRALNESPNDARMLQESCIRYFAGNHASQVALPRFEVLFREAINRKM